MIRGGVRLLGFALLAYVAVSVAQWYAPPCYVLVGVLPEHRIAIVFDQCRGRAGYESLPPLPNPSGSYTPV